jgi:ferredoxin
MAYVVTDACINCKYQDCVPVCPVDCFFEGKNMVAIDPDICIDCGVCELECPVQAIIPDTKEGAEIWLERNRKWSKEWPNIVKKGPVPEDADKWAEVKDKYPKYFEGEIL